MTTLRDLEGARVLHPRAVIDAVGDRRRTAVGAGGGEGDVDRRDVPSVRACRPARVEHDDRRRMGSAVTAHRDQERLQHLFVPGLVGREVIEPVVPGARDAEGRAVRPKRSVVNPIVNRPDAARRIGRGERQDHRRQVPARRQGPVDASGGHRRDRVNREPHGVDRLVVPREVRGIGFEGVRSVTGDDNRRRVILPRPAIRPHMGHIDTRTADVPRFHLDRDGRDVPASEAGGAGHRVDGDRRDDVRRDRP